MIINDYSVIPGIHQGQSVVKERAGALESAGHEFKSYRWLLLM